MYEYVTMYLLYTTHIVRVHMNFNAPKANTLKATCDRVFK